jgi:endonuclease YncB( thermonuclease family)
MLIRLLTAIALLFAAAAAQAGPESLRLGGKAKVVDVVDGDTVRLDDGSQVRLVGIQAPMLSLGRAKVSDWPLAGQARDVLREWALGQTVELRYGGQDKDRNGRRLAHLIDGQGRWLQGEMLKAGWARVYSFPDNRALVAEMLDLERAARAARRGIWNHPYYRVRVAKEAEIGKDRFELVEDIVKRVNVWGKRTYLNMGNDEPATFAAAIIADGGQLFAQSGLMPRDLVGRRIRVRGWVVGDRQPIIEITHPEQIEVLD